MIKVLDPFKTEFQDDQLIRFTPRTDKQEDSLVHRPTDDRAQDFARQTQRSTVQISRNASLLYSRTREHELRDATRKPHIPNGPNGAEETMIPVLRTNLYFCLKDANSIQDFLRDGKNLRYLDDVKRMCCQRSDCTRRGG